MAVFYKPPKKNTLPASFECQCSSLDIHGRGVARSADRVWFIAGLMPGEKARAVPISTKDNYGTAKITKIIEYSDERRAGDCPQLKNCGGCPLQHLPLKLSLKAKAAGIRKLFKRALDQDLGAPAHIVQSPEYGYRRVCRLAARTDHGKVMLGFRSAFSQEVVPLNECLVLTDRLNSLLAPLYKLINSLSIKKSVGHAELVDSDGAPGMLLRLTCELPESDEKKLQDFAQDFGTVIYVQEPYEHYITKEELLKERCLTGNEDKLYLNLDNTHRLKFSPSAFVQVNSGVNQKLLDLVLKEAEPQGKKILDLFCGLGNFSFPCALKGAEVVGVDIVKTMVEAANAQAQEYGLKDRAQFWIADLEAEFERQRWAKDSYDAVILDPGRSGAKRACTFLSRMQVPKIIMISCNPLAASRDAAELCKAGFEVQSWSVLDMFPRTSHVEMMLVFTPKEGARPKS